MLPLTILLAVLLTSIEAFGLPWLGFFGLAWPLSIVGLLLVSRRVPPGWALLVAALLGLVLDLNSVAPFGLWTGYFLILTLIIRRVDMPVQPWPQRLQLLGLLVVAAALMPWIAWMISGREGGQGWSVFQGSLLRAALILPLIVGADFLVKPEERRL